MVSKSLTKTIVVIDAHALIHRAYHALPSFTNSKGEPTGALYGLASMLIKIVETLAPYALVAAYDLPKPTFRHHAYGEYKGKRAKSDDALVEQLQSSRALFAAFGIPILDAEGFEADDVIGTIVAQHAKDKDIAIIIASGDMDTLQLVQGKKVQVFTLKKGMNDTILYDETAVRERFGFEPLQLVDYKGLRGDVSDNIIGVPGIGEKTATLIIKDFGSIEALYKALQAKDFSHQGLSPRIVEILRAHEEDAIFSKTLATIRKDAPVLYEIPEITYRDSVQTEALVAYLLSCEFRSLVPRVQKLFALVDLQPEEDTAVDQDLLRKAAVALWVSNSDIGNASLVQILDATKSKNLAEAYSFLEKELEQKGLRTIFETLELPLIPIMKTMHERGICIDKEYLMVLGARMQETLTRIEKEVTIQTGISINLNSPKQLSGLLFDTLGLKPKGKKKENGTYTTNAEALEGLMEAHPIISLILEYREVQKLLGTYVQGLLEHTKEDGRIHATFLQHGTTTGRFSSLDPNLQNIPIKTEAGREIRHSFVAAQGHTFVSSDYSQIELRMLAILSKDTLLCGVFDRNEDIHTQVASSVFKVAADAVTAEMRRRAKIINFGIIYGMGVSALQKNLGSTREEAQTFYAKYFEAFPTIAQYLEQTKEEARTKGYTETLFGRRRYFPAIHSKLPFVRSMAERMATNAPLQGSAADIIKLAIIAVDTALKEQGLEEKVHLILQIHDELVYEVADEVVAIATELIRTHMASVLDTTPLPFRGVRVPLAVSIGTGKRLDELK